MLPQTKKELAAVDGMGVFKANRYGDQILLLVRRYRPVTEPKKAKSKGKELRKNIQTARHGSFQSYMDKVIAKGSTEAYQSWSEKEDQQIIREYEDGKTIKEMSEIHKRTQGAIRSRLRKLELR